MLNKERSECGIKAIRRSILKIMIDNSYSIIIWTVLIAWSTINIAYFIKVHRPVSIRSDGILCISIQCFIDSGIPYSSQRIQWCIYQFSPWNKLHRAVYPNL